MRKSKTFEPSWSRTASFGGFGHRCERGLLLSLPSWQGSQSDLKPWQKSSDSSQVNEIMTRATNCWADDVVLDHPADRVRGAGDLVGAGSVASIRVLSHQVNSPHAGGVLTVRAKVQRDLERDCYVTFSRYLFDRNGTRHENTGPQVMTAQAIRNMDAMAPDELNVQMLVPANFPPGPGSMTTVLEYRCNPLQHVVRPIPVEMNIPFEVLP
jgi:hypothetical protein